LTQEETMSTTQVSKDTQRNPIQYVTPPVEISENEKGIQIAVDMPGVATNGATVELNDGVLTLEGHVETVDGRRPRHYRRRFSLTDMTVFDIDNVSAKMSHGVLEVEIPKTAKPAPRQIKITTS
jgi:HSP20 family protein